MYNNKVKVIQDWPELQKVKDVQLFQGFANFYCRFIHNYSDLTVLLTQLTQKGTPWSFSDSCCTSFETLKKAFTTHCWNWRIRLCSWCHSVHYHSVRQSGSSSRFPLPDFHLHGVELWRPQQRASCHFRSVQVLETLLRRVSNSGWCYHGP